MLKLLSSRRGRSRWIDGQFEPREGDWLLQVRLKFWKGSEPQLGVGGAKVLTLLHVLTYMTLLRFFFFFFFSRQGQANCAELCSQQPGEKQRSHGAQLKWIGLPEPAPALVPGLCPYTEVRLLESQLGDRGQNASCWVGVSVCKLPPLRLRKEWTVVPCSVKPSASTWAHWEARSYGGQRGFNFSKQVFFLEL